MLNEDQESKLNLNFNQLSLHTSKGRRYTNLGYRNTGTYSQVDNQ